MNVNQDSGTSPTANAVIAMDTLTFVIHVQESVSIARATPLGLNVKVASVVTMEIPQEALHCRVRHAFAQEEPVAGISFQRLVS